MEKLGKLSQNKVVILAYTSKMADMKQSDADKIINDLKSAGIDVRNEWYYEELKPKTWVKRAVTLVTRACTCRTHEQMKLEIPCC